MDNIPINTFKFTDINIKDYLHSTVIPSPTRFWPWRTGENHTILTIFMKIAK